MANFTFTEAKHRLATGALNLSTADLRVLLVMDGSTVPDEEDAENLDDFTALNEYDGAGYARQALTGETVTKDEALNLSRLTAADVAMGNLGAGTDPAIGALIFVHTGSDATALPVAYFDSSGFPFLGTGSAVTLRIAAAGLLRVT